MTPSRTPAAAGLAAALQRMARYDESIADGTWVSGPRDG
jgi:hypothetical protein